MGYAGNGRVWEQGARHGGTSDGKSHILSGRQHRALLQGARVLVDELMEDYANMYKGRNPADTVVVAECLPKPFRGRYTESFVKRFIVCIITVSSRLADWHGEEIANSTGECLALYAITEKAISSLTLEDNELGKAVEEDADIDFRTFEKVAFVDGEYTFLFDSSLDGISDGEIPGYDGIPLNVGDWFTPIYGEPAHPYLCDDDPPEGQETMEMFRSSG